jgi:protein required for attachment to host cells
MSGKKPYFRIPHDAYVFVGDGRKALFLRNEGNEISLHLKAERVFQHQNPPTREQGSDSPGRAFSSIDARRSAMEQADWHDIEEHRFARDVAGALESISRAKNFPVLVIAAPPRTLAELRRSLHRDVEKKIIAEIDKDLTGLSIPEIQKYLMA